MSIKARKAQTIDAASGEDIDILDVIYSDDQETAQDLTGFTAKVAIAINGTIVLDSWSESPPQITVDFPNRTQGELSIAISGDDTDDLNGTVEFEVQLTDSNGKRQRASWGYINLPENLIAA